MLVWIGALIWLVILFLPWRPWSVRESLESVGASEQQDLKDITVLIPARNEASVIGGTLSALLHQGRGLTIIVIDDQSTDSTTTIARTFQRVKVITGTPLPENWSGKLWALEQARKKIKTRLVLLLDADIKLHPGIIIALKEKMEKDHIAFISLMVRLRMAVFWEKLLMPAFVYFFKMLYPFSLSNIPKVKRVAAAAGGCVLLETEALNKIGGFKKVKEALIDDCALCHEIKLAGYKTWIGLTHSAESCRSYPSLKSIWNMVARTAFTQLHYSFLWLLIVTALFGLTFFVPLIGIFANEVIVRVLASISLIAMMVTYIPTLRFYKIPVYWVLTMPFIAFLYLAMTWSSAFRYWKGQRSEWKGRVYQ